MQIGGIEKCSLVDFPSHIAAIVFTQGCNFRCGYCYNPELVFPTLFQESIPEKEIWDFLKTRVGKLEGLVITGGEPTMQPDLIPFIKKARKMGFKIKLDTNGGNPEALEDIISHKIVDYFAMDIKGPLEEYENITCSAITPERIQKSVRLIMGSGTKYEFRTTVVKSQLSKGDFEKIGKLIKGAPLYALQKLVIPPEYKINDQRFLEKKTYSDKEFLEIKEGMMRFVEKCIIR